MKIKFLILAFVVFALPTFAKENAIESDLNTNLSATKQDHRDSEIKPFEFDKLFADAEKYYKSAKAWNKIKCQPKTGFLCNKHECNKRDIEATLVLDKKDKTVTRCEGKNCETFEAEFEQTGVYFNIQTKGPVGTLIRVLGDSRYKEITTVALDAYVANGECVISE
ncbi:MAG: hypothetical protein FJX34_02460 [Alphaproteobacteria bacterium]|nr:hypothetical protein [Alphaproteobacteria bacterium]